MALMHANYLGTKWATRGNLAVSAIGDQQTALHGYCIDFRKATIGR